MTRATGRDSDGLTDGSREFGTPEPTWLRFGAALASPSMRVAIAGAGNVGQHVADVAARRRPRGPADRAEPERRGPGHTPAGIEWYVGDACEVASLREAGLEKCDVLVAATGDDEDNLVVSLLAKQEFGMPRGRSPG